MFVYDRLTEEAGTGWYPSLHQDEPCHVTMFDGNHGSLEDKCGTTAWLRVET